MPLSDDEFDGFPLNVSQEVANAQEISTALLEFAVNALHFGQLGLVLRPSVDSLYALNKTRERYATIYRDALQKVLETPCSVNDLLIFSLLNGGRRRDAMLAAFQQREPTIYRPKASRIKTLEADQVSVAELSATRLRRQFTSIKDKPEDWNDALRDYLRASCLPILTEQLEIDMGLEHQKLLDATIPAKGHLSLLNPGAQLKNVKLV